MKKFLLSSALAMTATALVCAGTMVTPGNKTVYTFADLAKIDTSGVTADGQNYVVANDVTISETDTLRLVSGDVVKLKNGVLVTVNGYADFASADTATITTDSIGAKPYGVKVYGETSGASVKNVTFLYGGLRYGSLKPLTVDNCTFQYVNTKLNTSAAIQFNMANSGNVIKNSRFIRNDRSSIGGAANSTNGLLFKGNYLEGNTTTNRNYPQISVTVGGADSIIIADNTVVGDTTHTMVGGIGVNNMLGITGDNNVLISGNTIKNNRYGFTAIGTMNVRIVNNQIVSNKYETNANNGGSGISLYATNYKMKAYVEGNNIEDNLWGITIIGGGDINIGKTGDASAADYNPGKNTFKNNGNNNVLYDLYNNGVDTVYAQGNTWNVATQDSVSIESVITHKADNASLGLVIFMPDHQVASAIEGVTASAEGVSEVYTLDGRKVVSTESLRRGIYVGRKNGKSVKFVIR
jgi:hypothetical protein